MKRYAETNGSKLAAKLRKQANGMTDEERKQHFEAGIKMIYQNAMLKGKTKRRRK